MRNHSRVVFRLLLAIDIGLSLDQQWGVIGSEICEDWLGEFSASLREKLSQKGA
jgi:hypothetical protein